MRWTYVGNPSAQVSGWIHSSSTSAHLVHLLLCYIDSARPCAPQSQSGEMQRIQLNCYLMTVDTCWDECFALLFSYLDEVDSSGERKLWPDILSVEKSSKTHPLHWVTCSIITMNTEASFFFYSITHALSCCHKSTKCEWIDGAFSISDTVCVSFSCSSCMSSIQIF